MEFENGLIGLDKIVYAKPLPSDVAAHKPLTEAQAAERDLEAPTPAKPYFPVTKSALNKLGGLIKVTEDGDIIRNFSGTWKSIVKFNSKQTFVWYMGKKLPAAKVAYYYYHGYYPTAFVKRKDNEKGFTIDNLDVALNTNNDALDSMFKGEDGSYCMTNWGTYQPDRILKWNKVEGRQPSHDALGQKFDDRRAAGEAIPKSVQGLFFLPPTALIALEKAADKLIEENGGFKAANCLRPALR